VRGALRLRRDMVARPVQQGLVRSHTVPGNVAKSRRPSHPGRYCRFAESPFRTTSPNFGACTGSNWHLFPHPATAAAGASRGNAETNQICLIHMRIARISRAAPQQSRPISNTLRSTFKKCPPKRGQQFRNAMNGLSIVCVEPRVDRPAALSDVLTTRQRDRIHAISDCAVKLQRTQLQLDRLRFAEQGYP
jgi:hypothetical protein